MEEECLSRRPGPLALMAFPLLFHEKGHIVSPSGAEEIPSALSCLTVPTGTMGNTVGKCVQLLKQHEDPRHLGIVLYLEQTGGHLNKRKLS